ncbi:MAG TPA: hypothetical protein VFV94_16045 [Polyangiaceae bacterium]|nr:hypothetical protein [Polyangiaceae bacterium]
MRLERERFGARRSRLGRKRRNRGSSLDERRGRDEQRLSTLRESFRAVLGHPRAEHGVRFPRRTRELRRAVVPRRTERSTAGDDEHEQQTTQQRVGFREPANQLEQRRVRHDVGEYFRVARAVPSKRKTSSSAIAFMTPAKLIPGRSGSKRAAVRARHRAGC